MKEIVKDVLDYLRTVRVPVPASTIQKAVKINWTSVQNALEIIQTVQECWFMDEVQGVRGKKYVLKEPWDAAIKMDSRLRKKILEVIEDHQFWKEDP